jgi:hypothetical protein
MKLQMDKANNPFISIDQYLALNDALIKRVHYEGQILRTDDEITPACQATAAAPAALVCPASEFIKTKVFLTPKDHINLEASSTYTKGENGGAQKQNEVIATVSGDFPFKERPGVGFVGSGEMHQDGSFELSVGIGINVSAFGAASPIKLSEKIEFIYDSKCGPGIKASASAKAKMGPLGTEAGASVEGVIFLIKGF